MIYGRFGYGLSTTVIDWEIDPRVTPMDVRTQRKKQRHQVELAVEDGNEQRCLAVRVAVFEPGAGLYEQANHLCCALFMI